MWSRVPNTAENCTVVLFTWCSINVRQMELEKISLSQIWNLRIVFYHVDGLSHVFPSKLREIAASSSNSIIFKTINYFPTFYCIFQIYIKYDAFWKKDHLHSLTISKVFDSKELWLLECLKVRFTEHPSTGNVFTGCKHWLHQHSSTFYLIFY